MKGDVAAVSVVDGVTELYEGFALGEREVVYTVLATVQGDSDAARVVALLRGWCLLDVTARADAAIAVDHEMVADVSPTTVLVPHANGLDVVVLGPGAGGAVDENAGDWALGSLELFGGHVVFLTIGRSHHSSRSRRLGPRLR